MGGARRVVAAGSRAGAAKLYHGGGENRLCADNPPPAYAKTISAALILRLPSLRANMAQVNALRAQLVAMQPRYTHLSLPMELLHGTADTIVPIAVHSIPFVQQVASARLQVIDGAGHMPHYSHRGEVLAAIARAEARAALH